MTSPRPYTRRHRRDRAARQIAQMTLGALGLLCIGGLWWLLSPVDPAAHRVSGSPVFAVAPRTGPPASNASPTASRSALVMLPAPAATPILASVEADPATLAPELTPPPAEPALDQLAASPAPAPPTFNGRPIRPVRNVSMLVTAYSPDERSCGIHADGITASGYSVWTNGMKLVAADAKLFAFGDLVSIPGYHDGQVVPVLDRGGAIKGQRLDVLYPTHEIARQWGAQRLSVTVWEYAD